MNSTYPANMLSNLAKALMPPDKTAENMKTQAYVMSAAANRDRDLAAAEEYKQKAAEREARNQMRTPDAMQNAALYAMGMSPNSPQAMDLATAMKTGRNPVTPGQPAVELPKFNDSPVGNYDLASVMGGQDIGIETLAPATQPVERPVDQTQLSDLARRMGDFLGMNAATGDTNYQQLQAGVGQRMENEILQKAVSGQQLTPQDMAILKASAIYDGNGNRYTGQTSEALQFTEGNRVRMNDADNATSRSNNAASNATSRGNNAATIKGAMERHMTEGPNSGDPEKAAKAAAAEMEAINAVDISIPFKRQVPLTNPRYAKFARIYNALKDTDQLGARKLRYYAQQEGLIQDSLGD